MRVFLYKKKRYLAFFLFILFIVNNVSCLKADRSVKKLTGYNVVALIDKKIDDGTLSYSDVFEQEYYDFNERNNDTDAMLNNLLQKVKTNVASYKKRTNEYKKKIDIDKILSDNLHKLADRILDVDNLKYNIYGSDGKRWFAKDNNLKAPLNYFQQQFLMLARHETLRKLTKLMAEKIIKGNQQYKANYGSFWVIYSKENRLERCFVILNKKLNKIENKILNKQQLSELEINLLKSVIDMKKFNNIQTDDVSEYLAKAALLAKTNIIVKRAEQLLLKTNN